MCDPKIVHYLVFGLLLLAPGGSVLASTNDAFDPRPLVRKVEANVEAVRAFESPARHANNTAVLRCVVEKIRDARVLLDDLSSMVASMTQGAVQVAQAGNAPLDVPAQGASEIAVMVALVKSVSESSALVSAARRCFAISEDTEIRRLPAVESATEIRWLPEVELAPVSTISTIGRLR